MDDLLHVEDGRRADAIPAQKQVLRPHPRPCARATATSGKSPDAPRQPGRTRTWLSSERFVAEGRCPGREGLAYARIGMVFGQPAGIKKFEKYRWPQTRRPDRRHHRALRTSDVGPGDGADRSGTIGEGNDPGKSAANRQNSALSQSHRHRRLNSRSIKTEAGNEGPAIPERGGPLNAQDLDSLAVIVPLTEVGGKPENI